MFAVGTLLISAVVSAEFTVGPGPDFESTLNAAPFPESTEQHLPFSYHTLGQQSSLVTFENSDCSHLLKMKHSDNPGFKCGLSCSFTTRLGICPGRKPF